MPRTPAALSARATDAPEAPDADVSRRILDAAEALFAGGGDGAASTRAIAERAGIGKRMLFYYFASKEAVYRAVLERVVSGMVAIHQRFRSEPGPMGLGGDGKGKD